MEPIISFRLDKIPGSGVLVIGNHDLYNYYHLRIVLSKDKSVVIYDRVLESAPSYIIDGLNSNTTYYVEISYGDNPEGEFTLFHTRTTFAMTWYFVKVDYNDNDGNRGPSSRLVVSTTSNVSIPLDSIIPSRMGCEFLGWSTSSTDSEPMFQPEDSISFNASSTDRYTPDEIVLYAVWRIIPGFNPRSTEIDWTSSMSQTYEFYLVDPDTWGDYRSIDTVTKCSIERDRTIQTLGSATIDSTENLGECYIRAYLVVDQNGLHRREPLGTFLVQTPSISFDGKSTSISLDAYTPLIELKGTMPPIGYSLVKGQNIMDAASMLCREKMRAPVVRASASDVLEDNFISNLDDTWLTFVDDLIANAKFRFGLDEMSRVIFEPEQDIASLQSVWTYDDSNSSILYPAVTNERDLYGIPNVVEVVYTASVGYKFARIVNDDPNSPVSTVSRGREVVYRDTNPNFIGIPTQEYIDNYAIQLLRNLSCLEHKITYKHGYCPVRIGDCVTLNYKKAGLENVRAQVVSQTIDCTTGCPVSETAVYTTKLWR